MKLTVFALCLLMASGITVADEGSYEFDYEDEEPSGVGYEDYTAFDCGQIRAELRRLERETKGSKQAAIGSALFNLIGVVVRDAGSKNEHPFGQVIGDAISDALGNATTRATGQHRDAAGRYAQLRQQYNVRCK